MTKFICVFCRKLNEKPSIPEVLTKENLWIVSGLCKECYQIDKTVKNKVK